MKSREKKSNILKKFCIITNFMKSRMKMYYLTLHLHQRADRKNEQYYPIKNGNILKILCYIIRQQKDRKKRDKMIKGNVMESRRKNGNILEQFCSIIRRQKDKKRRFLQNCLWQIHFQPTTDGLKTTKTQNT